MLLKTNFLLYLEGIQVPFLSISISESLGGFPNAAIQLPPTSLGLKLVSKTVVHIFGPDPLSGNPCLIFEGFLTKVDYSKSAEGRQLTLSAESLVAIWEETKLYTDDQFLPANYLATTEAGVSLRWQQIQRIGDKLEAKELTEKEVEKRATMLGSSRILLQFINEVSEMLKTSNGDYSKMIERLLEAFSRGSLFFGLWSKGYYIIPSVITLPNIGRAEAYKTELLLSQFEAISRSLSKLSNTNPLSIMDALVLFLRTFHYSIIVPAAPTKSIQFLRNQTDKTAYQSRVILTPELSTAPPAKCNVWFPNQYNTFGYNRQFKGEPTRLVTSLQIPIGSTGFDSTIYNNFYVYPHAARDGNGASTVLTPTKEEWYSGINRINESLPVNHEYNKTYTVEDGVVVKREDSEDVKDGYDESLKQSMEEISLSLFARAKSAGRQFSVTGEWSPYRMLGLPGAVLDPDDNSAFVGTVVGIQSQISANGQASQTAIFNHVKHVLTDSSAFVTGRDGVVSQAEETISGDVSDVLMDADIYGFENIGQELYPLLVEGRLREGSNLWNYVDKDTVWKDFGANLKSQTTVNKNYDGSILSAVRDPKTNKLPEMKESTRHEYRSNLLYRSLKSLSSIPAAKDRLLGLRYNRRELVPKDRYWAGINIDVSKNPSDAEFAGDISKLLEPAEYLEAREFLRKLDSTFSRTNQTVAESLNIKILELEEVNRQLSEPRTYNSFLNTPLRDSLLKKKEELEKGIEDIRNSQETRTTLENQSTKTIAEALKPFNKVRQQHVRLSLGTLKTALGNSTPIQTHNPTGTDPVILIKK